MEEPNVPPNTSDQRGDTPNEPISEEFRKSMLEFLLKRIYQQGDFPALSESISAINRIASSERESLAALSNLILKDFALTNKLLVLVNSTPFIPYGGGDISTVSRAVAILGFDAVKSVALTLLLFEHLNSHKDLACLKNEFLRALFSGVLAREISHRALARGIEEAFICAMFHNLGRLLAMRYFSEEDKETHRIMAQRHVDEDSASAQVLGISCRELGMTVARGWHFPEQIIYSMGTLPDEPVQNPESNVDKLLMLAVFASELCETIAHTPYEQTADEIRDVITRFSEGMPLTERQMLDAIDRTVAEVVQYANIIQLDLQKIPFGRRISQSEEDSALDDAATQEEANEFGGDAEPDADDDSLDILTVGIVDISDALADGSPLRKTLQAILQTLYRGLGFRHVLLCTVDAYRGTMDARFGFGQGIEMLIPNFRFPLAGSVSVFQAAVAKGMDIVVADIDSPHICDHIPEWYRQATTAQTFALFPLNLGDVPVGLIYADKEFGTICFSESERGLLRTLRNQALLAIRQSL
jgi:HD-like signal output (HDOD) protein